MKEQWIGVDEAAELLQVRPETVLAMVRFRQLPVAQFSLDVRIWRKAVEEKAARSATHTAAARLNEKGAGDG